MNWDEAKQLVQSVEDAFGAADLAAIERGFTEDAVARFADFPEMRGREAIMRFLQARFARTQGLPADQDAALPDGRHVGEHLGRELAGCPDRQADARARHRNLGRAQRSHRAMGRYVQRVGEGRASSDTDRIVS